MTNPNPTEAEVRAMRDLVAERPSSDENWDSCRDYWMRPDSIEWLRLWVEKIKAKGKS